MTKETEALKMAIEAMSCISQSRGDPLLKAIRACKEALEQDDRVYTNTNHGFTLKDRHFYVEGDGGIWDENFDYDASIAVYGDFEDDEDKKQYAQMVCDALNAQREALEQPAQEALKMENYILVYENDLSALTTRVNYLLSKGYSPVGGVAFQNHVGGTSFCQAMIVEDK